MITLSAGTASAATAPFPPTQCLPTLLLQTHCLPTEV